MIDLGSEVTPQTRYLHLKDKTITLSLQPDGSYTDSDGTVYPPILFDPGFCGLSPFETGKGDPWWKRACVYHDRNFNLAKLGYQDSTKDNLKTFGDFSVNIATGMLEGAYMVLTGPFYWLVGGVLGFFREEQISK